MKLLQGPWSEWGVVEPTALAIGVFDGVHLGHRSVLEEFVALASGRGLVAGVVTFDRHPISLLAPDRAPKMLSTIDQRVEQFAALGADVVAVLPFDDEMRSMAPGSFVSEILVGRLGAALIVVGEDFRFGQDRAGDPALLRQMGPEHGFETVVVDLVGEDQPISSTRIREMLASGDVAGAAELLGRRYQLTGEVVAGRGRSLATGAPTANIDVATSVAIPRRGVYAVFAGAGELVPAVANVGVRPTFGAGGSETIEVHLLDRDQDLTGEVLRVDFVQRIRSEHEFIDAEALAEQIEEDIGRVREILAKHTP